MGFFVQTIFADRYIHRRELRLVSLESSSNIEYRSKKISFGFVFYRELSRFKFRRVNSFVFIHIFRNFCLNFCQFCKDLLKFLILVLLILFLKTKSIVDCFDLIFCQKFGLNISKFSLFHQKQHEISFFSPL